jgi:hypothetical protein
MVVEERPVDVLDLEGALVVKPRSPPELVDVVAEQDVEGPVENIFLKFALAGKQTYFSSFSLFLIIKVPQLAFSIHGAGNTKGGKYHCTIDLLFDWFGLVCFANKNQNCQLSYS